MLVSDNAKHGVNKFIAINLNLPISHRSEDSSDLCEGGIVKIIRECLRMEVVHAKRAPIYYLRHVTEVQNWTLFQGAFNIDPSLDIFFSIL